MLLDQHFVYLSVYIIVFILFYFISFLTILSSISLKGSRIPLFNLFWAKQTDPLILLGIVILIAFVFLSYFLNDGGSEKLTWKLCTTRMQRRHQTFPALSHCRCSRTHLRTTTLPRSPKQPALSTWKSCAQSPCRFAPPCGSLRNHSSGSRRRYCQKSRPHAACELIKYLMQRIMAGKAKNY